MWLYAPAHLQLWSMLNSEVVSGLRVVESYVEDESLLVAFKSEVLLTLRTLSLQSNQVGSLFDMNDHGFEVVLHKKIAKERRSYIGVSVCSPIISEFWREDE